MKWLAIIWLLLLALPIPTAAQDTACEGFTSRLAVGDTGQVTPGSANNVRSQPAAAGDLIGKLEPGAHFIVLDGPVCAEGYTWWQVQSIADSSLVGYTVEGVPDDYWLEPVDLTPAKLALSPDDISLDFTPFANTVQVKLRTPEDGSNYFLDVSPEHIHVSFPDLYYSEFVAPFIFFYPVDFFMTYDTDFYNGALAYHATLYDDTPDELGDARIPFQPSFRAALIHQSHFQYLQGEGFRGYRYLKQNAQYPAPVRGGDLFYTFQGMTDDGTTYISAVLPVQSPLQDRYVDELNAAEDIFDNVGIKQEYAQPVSDHAANLADNTFVPPLAVLDGVILSLRLDGSGTMPPPVTNRFSTLPQIAPNTLVSESANVYRPSDNEYTAGEFVNGDTFVGSIYLYSQSHIARNTYYDGLLDFLALLEEKPATLDTVPNPLSVTEPWEIVGEVRYIETAVLDGVRLVVTDISSSADDPVYLYLFRGVNDEGHILLVDYNLERDGESFLPTLEALDTMIEGITFAIPTGQDEFPFIQYIREEK